MRDIASLTDYRPSLIGTMSTIGGTAVGIPVDCAGYKDVIGIVQAGALVGSTGSGVYLDFKVQESASPTGTNWTDITNGIVSAGSYTFTQMSIGHGVTAGTWIPYQAESKGEFVSGKDNNRLRYIRFHATLSGTVGLGPKLSAGFLLDRPYDTGYISGATSFASTNVELTKLL